MKKIDGYNLIINLKRKITIHISHRNCRNFLPMSNDHDKPETRVSSVINKCNDELKMPRRVIIGKN